MKGIASVKENSISSWLVNGKVKVGEMSVVLPGVSIFQESVVCFGGDPADGSPTATLL